MKRFHSSFLSFLLMALMCGVAVANAALSPEMQKAMARAEAGDAEAQNQVGTALQADKQFKEAYTWYEKAAVQGHGLATANLGFMYEMGLGAAKDQKKAFNLYSKAAESGRSEGMWKLASMYGDGKVVKRNKHLSCVWSLRGNRYVDQNNQFLLAVLGGQVAKWERTLSKSKMAKCRKEAEAWSPASAAAKSQK